jgi:hypothetical protein
MRTPILEFLQAHSDALRFKQEHQMLTRRIPNLYSRLAYWNKTKPETKLSIEFVRTWTAEKCDRVCRTAAVKNSSTIEQPRTSWYSLVLSIHGLPTMCNYDHDLGRVHNRRSIPTLYNHTLLPTGRIPNHNTEYYEQRKSSYINVSSRLAL